jgi:hypothetical protein
LFNPELKSRLDFWQLSPGAMWSAADEIETVSAAGRSGSMERLLPGLPVRVTAELQVPASGWDWWLAGVRLTDGRLVALRGTMIASATGNIQIWSNADPSKPAIDATVPRDLPEGGGRLLLVITSERFAASIGGVDIGDRDLPAPPVALVFAAKVDTGFVLVTDPVALPR